MSLPWNRLPDHRHSGHQNTAHTFTVFTATYNRAHTLRRPYESLGLQTYSDFEWLVVDDGSTDDTARLLQRWAADAQFPIRYIRQENQGKHVAYNRAIEEAKGQFLLPLDSDDALLPNALARLKHHWDDIQDDLKESFSAVTGLCVDEVGRVVGNRFPRDVWDSDSLTANYKYKIRGDKCGFHRIAVLRHFPMPRMEGGKSAIPEGMLWFTIARKYKTRFINEPLLINYRSDDSLSRPRHPETHAQGNAIYHLAQLNSNIDYLAVAPLEFLRSAALFARFSFHQGQSPIVQFRTLTNWRARILWIIGVPLGAAIYLRDLSRAGRR